MTTCLKAICHIVCAMASMWGDVIGMDRLNGRSVGWVWRTWRRRLDISWVDWGAADGGADGNCVFGAVEAGWDGDVTTRSCVSCGIVSM